MDMLRAALLRLVWMPDAAPGHGTLGGLQKVPEASLEQRNIKKVWRSGLADVCVHKCPISPRQMVEPMRGCDSFELVEYMDKCCSGKDCRAPPWH